MQSYASSDQGDHCCGAHHCLCVMFSFFLAPQIFLLDLKPHLLKKTQAIFLNFGISLCYAALQISASASDKPPAGQMLLLYIVQQRVSDIDRKSFSFCPGRYGLCSSLGRRWLHSCPVESRNTVSPSRSRTMTTRCF